MPTILVLLVLSFLPVSAVNNSNNITMPVSECELGYIFTTDGLNNANTPDEYRGIAVISEELNIYYAADLEALKNIANKFNVIHWEEDFKILVQNIDSNLEALDFVMEKEDLKILNDFQDERFNQMEIDWKNQGGVSIDQLANQFQID